MAWQNVMFDCEDVLIAAIILKVPTKIEANHIMMTAINVRFRVMSI
jgi:hypothetical protein